MGNGNIELRRNGLRAGGETFFGSVPAHFYLIGAKIFSTAPGPLTKRCLQLVGVRGLSHVSVMLQKSPKVSLKHSNRHEAVPKQVSFTKSLSPHSAQRFYRKNVVIFFQPGPIVTILGVYFVIKWKVKNHTEASRNGQTVSLPSPEGQTRRVQARVSSLSSQPFLLKMQKKALGKGKIMLIEEPVLKTRY